MSVAKVVALVPAAGLGVRMAGGRSAQGAAPPKQLLELDGVPILFLTLRRLAGCARIERLIVAVRAADRAEVEQRLKKESYAAKASVVEGGESRQDSVANALNAVPAGAELVLVHDAVRPFVEPALIERVLDAAAQTGAAIVGIPATDTVKQAEPGGTSHGPRVTSTIPRERIVLAQTPQVFRAGLLRQAFERAAADGFHGSDEAVLVERLGHPVTVVMGSWRNIKITQPADLALARFLLDSDPKS
ncbi:MAG TPA: 2-C-methyl-D-erythritol 4-phosphate cytidylyltransferase [Candidatus Acidoferrales bacterium]|nr:2-C-methyl-D-erythritol 4-phosphate cytidylyltransferase [Candidatus Acidoferrales bacterium]